MEISQKSIEYLTAVEKQAEEILTDKNEIIGLDQRRNDTRMGLRHLQKEKPKGKVWMASGPVLIKLSADKAETILKKDQVNTDAEINKIRSDLKVKVNRLRDLEYQSPVPGLTLQPMSGAEMSAINQVLGGHS
ncbi:unnamed protein product [Bemisia tabaci]|uniref:P53 and DNA damage-regulated protein 1 n=1 Tax=Bemisia tabaci TaxID=7038 RepID=A0A9P0AEM9_BEMTA|nr:PREDICTED: p53 and DNA damage-regulated protein 1 [Bemisia tabaci]XP_018897677.1 PREDICTED: p53 and DNA damage-regulated protein 1 [Bemisia tabaci]CAH0391092.1 unnamed protein product [Bemisia tabaci]